MNTRSNGPKKATSSEVAMERDRVSSRLIEQERAKTKQKTERLRALRLAHEANEAATKAAAQAATVAATGAKAGAKAAAKPAAKKAK